MNGDPRKEVYQKDQSAKGRKISALKHVMEDAAHRARKNAVACRICAEVFEALERSLKK